MAKGQKRLPQELQQYVDGLSNGQESGDDDEFIDVTTTRPIRKWSKTEEGTSFAGTLQGVRAGRYGPLHDVRLDDGHEETWPGQARVTPALQLCKLGGRFRMHFGGKVDTGKGSPMYDISIQIAKNDKLDAPRPLPATDDDVEEF